MTGPTTSIRLPDGSEVEIATDDPKQAAAVAQKIWTNRQASAPAAPKPRTFLNTAADFSNNVLDNVLPNWGDEFAGVGRGLRRLTQGRPFSEGFHEAQEGFKCDQATYKRAHPVLSTASAVGGLAVGLAAPAGRLAEGAGMGLRMAHGAAVGAGYGAVSGAGEGDNVGDRAANAVRSAAIGAAGGAVLAPIATGAVNVGRRALRVVPGAEAAARHLQNIPRAIMRRPLVGPGQLAVEQADRMIGQHANRGNISDGMGQPGAPASPAAVADAVQARSDIGVPAMPADVSEPMRGLTGWAARGMGPGQTRVVAALDARKAAEAARVRQHVVDTMGPAVDPVLQAEQHMTNAKAAAAPAYREAYAQPMVITPEIQGIMRTPAFQEALPHAVRNIRNAQGDPSALGFHMAEDGSIGSVHTLSTEGFDQVVRAMRDSGRIAAGTHPITGAPIHNTNSVHISARAGDLRDHLSAQNPAYADAVGRYADDMAQRDALQAGQNVRKLSGHEVAAQFRDRPADAHGAWTIGARTALADDASRFGVKHPTGNTAAHIRGALGDGVKQDAIGQMGGNTGAVRNLGNRLEAEQQGHITFNAVQGNSRTAHNQALDSDLNGAADRLSSLNPKRWLMDAVDHIAERGTIQFRNDVKARIAEVVTATNPQDVRELMAHVAERAEHDRTFASLLHRAGILGTKALVSTTVLPTPPLDTSH